MLLETSGSNGEHDMEKFTSFLDKGMQAGHILDGVVTGEPSKIQEIWKCRELPAMAILNGGAFCFAYDFSLPLRQFYEMVPVVKERCKPLAQTVCGFGHLGDCNLHLCVVFPEYSQEAYDLLEPFVYEYVSKLKGSFSSEHGLGFFKSKYLHYSKNNQAISLMKDVKSVFDPKGILNPYKVLPLQTK